MTNLPAVQQASALDENIRWATEMSHATMLPAQYRGQPGNLFFALEYADALGIGRIHALTSIHVIDGKPSASADLMAAKVRAAGHKLRIKGDDTYAEAQLVRSDDPDYPFDVRWDMARAERAGLLSKRGGNWQKYPAAMLRARAISEIVRMGASDVMAGAIYTPEELGAVVDQDGNILASAPQGGVQAVESYRENAPQQVQQASQTNQAARGGADGLLGHLQGDQTAPAVDVDALKVQMTDAASEDALRSLWTDNQEQLGNRRQEVLDHTTARLLEMRQPAAEEAAPVPAESTDEGVVDAEVVGDPQAAN